MCPIKSRLTSSRIKTALNIIPNNRILVMVPSFINSFISSIRKPRNSFFKIFNGTCVGILFNRMVFMLSSSEHRIIETRDCVFSQIERSAGTTLQIMSVLMLKERIIGISMKTSVTDNKTTQSKSTPFSRVSFHCSSSTVIAYTFYTFE